MKRKTAFLFLSALLLASCTPRGFSSSSASLSSSSSSSASGSSSSSASSSSPSSSSEETSQKTSSEPTSSDESSLSSSSEETSEDPERRGENDIIDRIAYASRKYGSGMGYDALLRKSGLQPYGRLKAKDVLSLIHIAFNGLLPDVCGARRYQGDFEKDYVTRELTPAEEADYLFMKEKGLWSGTYNPDLNVGKNDVATWLKRIHYYIGTSEADDFAATINRDFLYDHDPKEGAVASDYIYQSNLVSSEVISDNVRALTEEAFEADPESYGHFKNLLDAWENEEPYAPAESEMVITLRDLLLDAADFPSLWEVEQKLLAATGSSNYLVHSPKKIGAFSMGDRSLGCDVSSVGNDDLIRQLFGEGNCDYDTLVGQGFDVHAYAQERLSPLGLDEEVDALAAGLESFLRGLAVYSYSDYRGTDRFSDKGYIVYQTEDDPIFAANEAYSIGQLFDESPLNFEMTILYNPEFYTLSYIASLADDSSSFDQLKAFSLLGYADQVFSAFADLNENRGSKLTSLIGYDLISYFQKTSYYESAISKTSKLFFDLIAALKENATLNGWLSEEGVEALKEKADKVTHFLYAEYEGQDFDYSPFFTEEFTSDMGANIFVHNREDMVLHYDWMARELNANFSLSQYISLNMEPFTANAFYAPTVNGIYITPGYLFSKGYDMSKFSLEEVLSMFGLVMGHEITHGFDSNGCYYDGDGHYISESIFPEVDLAAFKKKQTKVIELYNYEVMPGFAQSGNTVLSEALADIGGLGLCLNIASHQEEFDYALYYRSLAANFMGKCSRNAYETRLSSDVHPMGAARLNTLMMARAKFQETFEIEDRDAMYRDPEKEIVIW